ncbi:MAG TPA: protein-glutamate O-methyltransferase CheR [Planctomycetota bacterium]|nr:protein-glutamate O-methyltransferase CheR [Planctomycetota bacterium]
MLAHAAPELTQAEFRHFQELVYTQAGIRLAASKLSLAQNRLQKRLLDLGMDSWSDYIDLVRTPGSRELQGCIEALTTNETFFFRHKDHWDLFIEQILKPWNATRTLRIWSAACSTGEEPWSAAIACREHRSDVRSTIEASDLNQRVLTQAQAGVYGTYALQKLTDYARDRWFSKAGDERWRVRDEVRNGVTFRQHNLLEPTRGSQVDVMFLRNVLIYFDEASKRRALDQVAQRLAPGGWLFLGGSESLPVGMPGFRPVRPQIYRREGRHD